MTEFEKTMAAMLEQRRGFWERVFLHHLDVFIAARSAELADEALAEWDKRFGGKP